MSLTTMDPCRRISPQKTYDSVIYLIPPLGHSGTVFENWCREFPQQEVHVIMSTSTEWRAELA